MSVWKYNQGKWMSKFWFQGKPYQKKGFKNKSDAQRWELQTKEALENPQAQIRTISFHELATRYLSWCEKRYQLNTYRSKARHFRLFLAYINNPHQSILEIHKSSYSDYLDTIAEESGTKTANRHHRDLKACFNWGIQNDLVQNNPIRTIAGFGEDEYIRYIPSSEDVQRVLLAASGQDQDMIVFLLDTGARVGEMFKLQWDDINLEKKEIILRTRKRKGGSLQSDKLSMTERLERVLKACWKTRNTESGLVFSDQAGKEWNYDRKRNMMIKVCERAGVKYFGFHALRHYVASVLADSGKATLGQIQRFLRHQRAATTENYLHELDKGMKDIADILDMKNTGTDSGTG